MKTVKEILEYIEEETKFIPEYCDPNIDPSDLYSGNKEDACTIGFAGGEYLALKNLKEWIES